MDQMLLEKIVVGGSLVLLCLIAIIGIWGNSLGHNPRRVYSSRAPLLKFYSYPLWNIIAFFSCGLMKYKSWREEHNQILINSGNEQDVWRKE